MNYVYKHRIKLNENIDRNIYIQNIYNKIHNFNVNYELELFLQYIRKKENNLDDKNIGFIYIMYNEYLNNQKYNTPISKCGRSIDSDERCEQLSNEKTSAPTDFIVFNKEITKHHNYIEKYMHNLLDEVRIQRHNINKKPHEFFDLPPHIVYDFLDKVIKEFVFHMPQYFYLTYREIENHYIKRGLDFNKEYNGHLLKNDGDMLLCDNE